MEMEKYLSGYCRRLDGSRMVEVILTDNAVTEVDCDYGTCPFQSECTIAASIRDLEHE
jgi:hypothetical protein